MNKIFKDKSDFSSDGDLYFFESDEYNLYISNDIFDDETIEYAKGIVNHLLEKYDYIIDKLLDLGLRDIYGQEYSDEYIKKNMGKPEITINFKKDDENPDWKFEYAGIIEFLEQQLDEHIISVEFVDDLELDDYIQIDG